MFTGVLVADINDYFCISQHYNRMGMSFLECFRMVVNWVIFVLTQA